MIFSQYNMLMFHIVFQTHSKTVGSYFPNIFSIKIPYPLVESCTKTWVMAPTILPFCSTGLPLSPCTIPPVFSSSFSSVICITKLLLVSSWFRSILLISACYSLTSPSTLHKTEASPVFTSCLYATGIFFNVIPSSAPL